MKKISAPRSIRPLISLTLLILLVATGAWAKPTTPEQARTVVQNWLGLEAQPLETALGGEIGEVQAFYHKDLPIYYVVRLHPAGLVMVPADDLVEPIVAFVNGATAYDPSPQNPLAAMVSRDLTGRVLKARQVETLALETGGAPAPATPQSRARQKWVLLGQAAGLPGQETAGSLTKISHMRVAPLIKSKWNQKHAASDSLNACYNYYTPPNQAGDSDNYYSGCVATAMAQLMRHWKYPTTGVGTASFDITVSDNATTRALRGGDGKGGPYKWEWMPLTTSSTTKLGRRRAIGALTADAGVSVNMGYAEGGSGTMAQFAAYALVNTFQYSNAIAGSPNDGYGKSSNIPDAARRSMINPNLDAGFPTLLGIDGIDTKTQETIGHCIVCDGYGFDSHTSYHHLNMGWSGADDVWYNLPTIDAGDGAYDIVGTVIYNIYQTGTGEIISGRVTDGHKPISGVTVTATGSAGTFQATTNDKGIYALAQVPSKSTFTITASKTGYNFRSKSVTTGESVNAVVAPSTPGESPTISPSVVCGNKWGINF